MTVFTSLILPALFLSIEWLRSGHIQLNYEGIFIIKLRKLGKKIPES